LHGIQLLVVDLLHRVILLGLLHQFFTLGGRVLAKLSVIALLVLLCLLCIRL